MVLLHSLVILTIVCTIVCSALDGCDKNKSYTANSIYEANLKELQSSLLSSTIQTGFSNTSVGQYPDQVFGLALCRGDLSAESCKSCLGEAIDEASTECPYGKADKIWLDNCFLRYDNITFFSRMQTFGYYKCSKSNATGQQLATIGNLLNTLVSQAANSSKMFAAGFVNFTSFSKLYGLVQCTRDISKEDCYKCLYTCVANVPNFCKDNDAAYLFGDSCSIRFDQSIFYNTSAVPNAAAAAPPADTTNQTNNGGSTNTGRIAIFVVGPVIGALVILVAVWACLKWARNKQKPHVDMSYYNEHEGIGTNEGSVLFDLSTITSATNNFSNENKLGEGGFGQVYKGVLTNGQEIAVKRLSRNSYQGLEQLKNEVKLLAKLQHNNLVKLLGCCLDGQEKLLVYEYLSNTSLDKFLFDPAKRPKLDWQIRLKIIEGVARGLVYLHEDSRLKIVHRDLKAGNILLDVEMNPKIADFGLARLFNLDATHVNTSRIAGTYGYMAPEYAMRGAFSTKSDVFSYGILVLEILTGRNVCCKPGQMDEDILSYVWHHWEQGNSFEAIDKSVSGNCPSQELIRCLHVALLCVQEDPSERPNMANVILMLKSQSMSLPAPNAPLFFPGMTSTGGQTSQTENYSMATSENVGTGSVKGGT